MFNLLTRYAETATVIAVAGLALPAAAHGLSCRAPDAVSESAHDLPCDCGHPVPGGPYQVSGATDPLSDRGHQVSGLRDPLSGSTDGLPPGGHHLSGNAYPMPGGGTAAELPVPHHLS